MQIQSVLNAVQNLWCIPGDFPTVCLTEKSLASKLGKVFLSDISFLVLYMECNIQHIWQKHVQGFLGAGQAISLSGEVTKRRGKIKVNENVWNKNQYDQVVESTGVLASPVKKIIKKPICKDIALDSASYRSTSGT